MEIDDHIGCAISGIIADALILVEHGRVETQVRFFFLVCFCSLQCKKIFDVIDSFFTDFQKHRLSYGN